MNTASKEEQLRAYYRTLYAAWGPQHWWPARTRFEVVVGAYLTQNTSWTNVEMAFRRLRAAGVLSLRGIRAAPLAELEALIRSAGYFRQKAARLKTFVAFVDQRYGGSLHRMFAQPTRTLRQELLSLNGVGPETADSILLYAGQHPVFVVDAYTRRILERHEILPASAKYEDIRELFERALSHSPNTWGHRPSGTRPERSRRGQSERNPGASAAPIPSAPDFEARSSRPEARSQSSAHPPSPMSLAERSPLAQIYNDMHGLIVSVGKHYCLKPEPRCEQCPLRKFLP